MGGSAEMTAEPGMSRPASKVTTGEGISMGGSSGLAQHVGAEPADIGHFSGSAANKRKILQKREK